MNYFFNKMRGSTLVFALIILTVLSVFLGSVMQWQLNESRLAKIATSKTQAMIGSDGLQDYGINQIDDRLLDRSTLSEDEFQGSGALTLPSDDEVLGMLGLSASEATINSKELVVSKIPEVSTVRYVDPDDEVNKFDPDKGKNIFSRYILLFSRVDVDYVSDDVPPTSFLSSLLIEAREDHLFSNAIFSDSDLLVLKPPEFLIDGPVHSNGYLVLVPANNNIKFDGMVTTVDNISFPSATSYNVYFKKNATEFEAMSGDYAGSDWMEYAKSRWNGWLQTGSMGISERAPIGFNKKSNEKNKFIEIVQAPILVSENPNKVAESQKMGTKAGIVVEVEFQVNNLSYNDREWGVHYPSKTALSGEDPSSYTSPSYKSVSQGAAQTAYTGNRTDDRNTMTVKFHTYGNGSKKVYKQMGSSIQSVGIDYFNGSDKTTLEPFVITQDVGGDPIKMWDARRRLWIHIVEIDVDKLMTIIDDASLDTTIKNAWNGILYVHVKGKQGSDFVSIEALPELDPHRRIGVRVVNSKKLPQRAGGFTLVTNVPLYLKGSFNADGTVTASSATTKDAGYPEIPAALMADAITVLSDAWDDSLSRADVSKPGDDTYNDRAAIADDVEISAGILTGYGVFVSGGINNLVRYLEMWDGKKIAIRGSLAALFTSDVAYEPFQDFYVYYPPNRSFGMHPFFNDKTNPQFPPGDPLLRTWRKKFRQDVGLAQYNELKETFTTTSFTSTEFISKLDEIVKKYRDLE